MTKQLRRGAEQLGVPVSEAQAGILIRYLELLLEWNRKINLTAITQMDQAVELHLLDSIAVAPLLGEEESVLDLGAGGGLPGVPLAVLFPQKRFCLVDAVAKKVGFLKSASANLGLSNLKAVHARADGNPESEGIPRSSIVVSRALAAPERWLELAAQYVEPGGRVIAMLGAETDEPRMVGSLREVGRVGYVIPGTDIRRIAIAWMG